MNSFGLYKTYRILMITDRKSMTCIFSYRLADLEYNTIVPGRKYIFLE